MEAAGLILLIPCFLTAMAAWLGAVIFSCRAAKFRHPHIPYWRAMGLQSVVLEDYLYTEEAWPLRKRAIQCTLLFGISGVLGAVIGIFSGALH